MARRARHSLRHVNGGDSPTASGEHIIRDLLHDRRTGNTQRILAKRYGISLSSVKRILSNGCVRRPAGRSRRPI
jgi:DNA invertase Pin-like site-specific DNA recombinase